MKRRVKVQWTIPAKNKLATLPSRIRRAILDKTRALADCDPRTSHKRLRGPLAGHYCIKVGRYRAIYKVDEEELPNGDVLVFVRVVIVAVGIRKAGDRHDIYKLAERLIRFAEMEVQHDEETEDED